MAEDEKGIVKIGIKQFSNPTPKAAKNVFKTVLFIGVAWSFLAPTITEIPPEKIAMINTWVLRLVGLVRVGISFFGLDYKEESQ